MPCRNIEAMLVVVFHGMLALLFMQYYCSDPAETETLLRNDSTREIGTYRSLSNDTLPTNRKNAITSGSTRNKRNDHPTKAYFTSPKVKLQPILAIAIFSSWSFTDRRKAIRDTWARDCISDRRVLCKFFTDALNVHGEPIKDELREKLEKESRENYNDLVLLDSPAGTNFALRLLKAMEWTTNQHDFDYFLRMDDDHYLCLDRLIKELPFRPRHALYWGHLHCQKGVTRIDEGWLMLSSDLVRYFVHNQEHLPCHPMGDQAVAMWIYDLMTRQHVTWFGDHRIHHHPPAASFPELKMRKEICHTFLSLHGSYPIEMRIFDEITRKEAEVSESSCGIPPVEDLCPYRRESFDWKQFDSRYYSEPVPCVRNPVWRTGGERFVGRNEGRDALIGPK